MIEEILEYIIVSTEKNNFKKPLVSCFILQSFLFNNFNF